MVIYLSSLPREEKVFERKNAVKNNKRKVVRVLWMRERETPMAYA